MVAPAVCAGRFPIRGVLYLFALAERGQGWILVHSLFVPLYTVFFFITSNLLWRWALDSGGVYSKEF